MLPTLAVAVLGMAAMIGVTSNLQKTLDPSSDASGGTCTSTSHALDRTYVSRHFVKTGSGSVSAEKDRDYLKISQPDTAALAGTSIKFDQKAKGDFKTELTIKSIKTNGNVGQASLGFTVGTEGFYVGIKGNKDGTFQAYAQNKLNDVLGDTSTSQLKKMNFPIDIKVERTGSAVSYFYREEGVAKYVAIRQNDSVTEDPVKVEIFTSNLAPDFPSVSAVFSDFILRCGL